MSGYARKSIALASLLSQPDRSHPMRSALRLATVVGQILIGLVLIPTVLLLSVLRRKPKQLIWGPVPVINHKYWSSAMRSAGWDSVTLMDGFFEKINESTDFDIYFDQLLPRWIPGSRLRRQLTFYSAFHYVLRHARVIHMPFSGGPLGLTPYWRLESFFLRAFGVKTVILPHGGDSYLYSLVTDLSLRHALLSSYPDPARFESRISARVRHWTRFADVVMTGIAIDGIGRWDVTIPSMLAIDTDGWSPRRGRSFAADGSSSVVRVFHSTNHRGFKGSEFVTAAVANLQDKGLDVELVVAEGLQNQEVAALMRQCDILVEQLIFTGYALSGLEGMASGLPVLANLEDDSRTRVFRRYAFLDECPILSSTPETVERNLEILVRDPQLREKLGGAGRQYVEKYHSLDTARYLFGSIYKVILEGRHDIDLLNLFNPRTSEHSKGQPTVRHPLVENKLPVPPLGNARTDS